jgi:hypothetical protein
MYRSNNHSMILHTRKLFLSVQPRHNIRRRNTSSYILISSLSSEMIPTPLPVPYIPLEPSSPLLLNESLLFPLIPVLLLAYLNKCNLWHPDSFTTPLGRNSIPLLALRSSENHPQGSGVPRVLLMEGIEGLESIDVFWRFASHLVISGPVNKIL